MFYARVVFQTNASTAESHEDVNAARHWIEAERVARPESFQLGEIFERSPHWQVVATCDSSGWKPSQQNRRARCASFSA